MSRQAELEPPHAMKEAQRETISKNEKENENTTSMIGNVVSKILGMETTTARFYSWPCQSPRHSNPMVLMDVVIYLADERGAAIPQRLSFFEYD